MFLTILMVCAQAVQHDFVKVVCGDCDVDITDDEFYAIARNLTFPINEYIIPENSDFYHELVDEIIPEMNARKCSLAKIVIRGASSPEGPHRRNVVLANRRQKALFELIDKNMILPSEEDCLSAIEAPCDYEYLVRIMLEANDVDYDTVKAVVEKFSNDPISVKRELLAIHNGNLWTRLYHDYFGQLRYARVVLFFKPVLTGGSELSRDNLSQQLSKLSVQAPVLVYDNLAQEAVVRKPRRELLSVKTNLLYDFAYMPGGYDKFCPIPNVAIEYYPMHGHFTFGASFDCPWWQDYDGHKYFQVRNYQLETRYYFRSGSIAKNPPGEGAAYRGWYLQAYGHAGLYGIMLSEKKGWVGEGAGAGLGIGYVLPLTKQGHWRLELGAQFGYFLTKYDPFQWECPVDPTEHDGLYYYKWTLDAALFKERQYRFTWLGPTRVGLTLSYDLIYRKRK